MKFFVQILVIALFELILGQDPLQTVVSHTNTEKYVNARQRKVYSSNGEVDKFINEMNSQCPKFICSDVQQADQCAYRQGIESNEVYLHACNDGLSCDLLQTNFLFKTLKDIAQEEHISFKVNKKELVLDIFRSKIGNWSKSLNHQFYKYENQCSQREFFSNAQQILDQFWLLILNLEQKSDKNSVEDTICEHQIDFCSSKEDIPYSQSLAQECQQVEDCPYVIPQNLNSKLLGLTKAFQGMTGSGPSAVQHINVYHKEEQIPKEEFGKCECGFDGKRRCSLTLGDQYYCNLLNQVCRYAKGARNQESQEDIKKNMYLGLFYHKLQNLPECWRASFPRYDWEFQK